MGPIPMRALLTAASAAVVALSCASAPSEPPVFPPQPSRLCEDFAAAYVDVFIEYQAAVDEHKQTAKYEVAMKGQKLVAQLEAIREGMVRERCSPPVPTP